MHTEEHQSLLGIISVEVFIRGIKPPSNAASKTSSRLDTKTNVKDFYSNHKATCAVSTRLASFSLIAKYHTKAYINKKICSESTNLRRSGGSGFRTLDSRIRSVIRIAIKIVSLGRWAMPYPSKKFRQNPFTSLRVIRQTDRQTELKTWPPSSAEVITMMDSNWQQEHQNDVQLIESLYVTNYRLLWSHVDSEKSGHKILSLFLALAAPLVNNDNNNTH